MTKKIYLIVTMLLLSFTGAWADDYNPANPPDPMLKYKLTVSASPSEAGYASGGGSYLPGASITLSTSSRQNYEFLYWTSNGVKVSESRSFSYVMPDCPVEMIAVYGYNPVNPADPTTLNKYRLYVETNMEGSCTFNVVSGAKQNSNQYIRVSAQNISQGFKFQGWYEGETRISSVTSFNYMMPNQDITLTARFVYDPDSPTDPDSDESQTSIDTGLLGDVNHDGSVTMADANMVVNYYLATNKPEDFDVESADVNGDGFITMADANMIVNMFLGGK